MRLCNHRPPNNSLPWTCSASAPPAAEPQAVRRHREMISLAVLLAFQQISGAGSARTSLSWPDRPNPRGDTDWVVSVKIQPKWEEQPTKQFTLIKRDSLVYEVSTRMVPGSAAGQKDISDDKNVRLDSKACPGLSEVGDSFEKLRVSPLPQKFMALHPEVYRFWIATRHGSLREFEFLVPNGSYWGDLGEDPPALVAWLQGALRLVASCSHQ